MSGPLRVGVIGLGVGEQHIAGYAAHGGCEVVAICDFDPAVLAEVSGRHPGLRAVAVAEELLADPDIDAVSIASYDNFHHEQVKAALEAGKHVFVEKPLCQFREQADELHALLAANPTLRLSSNLPLRRSPRFELVRRMIGDGDFGRLYYLEADYDYGRLHKLTAGWRGDLDHYSVVLGGAVHLVDLLLWLTGDQVVRVSARGNRLATEGTKFRFDDLVVATLELESGALAKVSANFGCVHPHFHGLKVFGTEATFVNGPELGTLYRKRGEDAIASPVDAAYPGVGKDELIGDFVDSILGGAVPAVSADEVFEAMAVCFAIEEAAVSGETVAVEGFG